MAEGKSYNHGVVDSGNVKEAFGKDTSNYTGSKTEERGAKPAGSGEDLGHTLKGATANQRNP